MSFILWNVKSFARKGTADNKIDNNSVFLALIQYFFYCHQYTSYRVDLDAHF